MRFLMFFTMLVAGPGAFWMNTLNKLLGKNERDPALQAVLVPWWKKLYGLAYKTLVGAAFAWCGLTAGYVYYTNGFHVPSRGAAAKTWGTSEAGVSIDFKKDGIPYGATLHLDHDCDCKGGNNHVGFAHGDCAPVDILKKGGTIDVEGGNQSNQVKVSTFKMCEVCEAHWADPDPKNPPPKITQSKNCTSAGQSGSTR